MAKRPQHDELESRMQSYELAYRMQMEVPGVIDLEGETEKTKEAYGLNQKETAEFGKQCLMARRLVEKGVRFVQIFRRMGQPRLPRACPCRPYQERGPTHDRSHQGFEKRGMLKTPWSFGSVNSAERRTTIAGAESTPLVGATTTKP